MVAFIFSFAVTLILMVCGILYGGRRPVGAALTWGEGMAAATFVFLVMFLAYGVVPHQWLTVADNEFAWRADSIVLGPGDILAKLPFVITYETVRDMIAAVIYVIFFGAQIVVWAAWQGRGKVKPKELPVSSFGRPLVKET